MDNKNSEFEFSVFGRVDLKELFDEWSSETEFETYQEPPQGWVLKYSYAFENDICALLFENVCDDGVTYYRVLFFGKEAETCSLVRKVRFRENDSFRVNAIGIDRYLNTLFVRRSNEAVKCDIYYNNIGETEVSIKGLSELFGIVVPQSDKRFILVDGMTVLFVRAPENSWLEMLSDDPHALISGELRDKGGDVTADEDDDKDGDEDEDEDDDESEDDTKCRAEPQKQDAIAEKTASDELHELIGLDNIKEKVDQIVAFAKLQKMAKEHGKKVEGINLNLSFLGNPGTAKTTVARIFARIMKENGILSNGDLIEVGRSDLVAKYTGQTAIKVKGVFNKAKGNILFIDEAYSLVDSWENEFGDEAIATIVQEMENNRDDMIVIFAGYPDKMEKFLSRNPGLRSRVPFVVQFKDYSADELTAIAKSEAARRGYSVTDAAEKKIHDICEAGMKMDEFGNGRFSRNLVEAAIMRAASRTMSTVQTDADLSAYFTLEDCDFTPPDNMKKEKKARTIGFSVA